MKRIIAVFLTILMLLTCATPCLAADSFASEYCISEEEGAEKWTAQFYIYGYLGDADYTDNVNIKDATIIQKWIAKIPVNAPVFHLISDKYEKSTDHVHVYKTSTLNPTCQHVGLTRYNCTCGEFYEANETAPTSHKWSQGDCNTPPTCSVCGETDGFAIGHLWDEPTCTTARTCSVCGETIGTPLGHSWNDATCTSPKTCSVCRETEGSAAGHSWADATCTAPKTCVKCFDESS